jgi:hypothetical protein
MPTEAAQIEFSEVTYESVGTGSSEFLEGRDTTCHGDRVVSVCPGSRDIVGMIANQEDAARLCDKAEFGGTKGCDSCEAGSTTAVLRKCSHREKGSNTGQLNFLPSNDTQIAGDQAENNAVRLKTFQRVSHSTA